MRLPVIRFGLVSLLAAFTATSPAVARGSTPESKAFGVTSAQTLFERSFQQLGLASHYQFHETVNILQRVNKTFPGSSTFDVSFAAPNRMATTLHVAHPSHGVTELDTVQVGSTKCQRPPRWICFPSPAPHPATLIHTLLAPRMTNVAYRTSIVLLHAPAVRATVVLASWRGNGIVYAGTLLLQPRSGLPLRFTSSVSSSGKLDVRETASFNFTKKVSIDLPRGRRVMP